MKDSKVGLIIIVIIVVLGIVLLNLRIKNNTGNTNTNVNNKKIVKKTYKGFDYEKLGTNAERIAYDNLDTENLRKLFINHILRANVVNEETLEDFKINSISQDITSGSAFRYIATGSFKCNSHVTCYVDDDGTISCPDICLNMPIDEYNEGTGYYDYKIVFDVKLDNGIYTFDGFRFNK